MVILHQPPGAWGLSSISPFCVKLEMYLKLAGIPYQVKGGDPRRAPKGKVPYVNLDGRYIGDSQLIIEHLKQRFGDPLDSGLTKAQVCHGHAVRRMLEEATYWCLVYLRWLPEDAWAVTRPVFADWFPMPLRLFMPDLIRWNLRRTLQGQGTLRHSHEEICSMANQDYSAVAGLLGDNEYLLGASPTSFDCTVYAFVSGVLAFPADSEVKRHLSGLANLMAYYQRVTERCFAASRTGEPSTT